MFIGAFNDNFDLVLLNVDYIKEIKTQILSHGKPGFTFRTIITDNNNKMYTTLSGDVFGDEYLERDNRKMYTAFIAGVHNEENLSREELVKGINGLLAQAALEVINNGKSTFYFNEEVAFVFNKKLYKNKKQI